MRKQFFLILFFSETFNIRIESASTLIRQPGPFSGTLQHKQQPEKFKTTEPFRR